MSNNQKENNNINNKYQVKPKTLTGLKQAIYIMKSIDAGEYPEQIVHKFEEDEQLVELWMSFLLHNKCIENQMNHKWSITGKGKQWIEKYEGTNTNTSVASTN